MAFRGQTRRRGRVCLGPQGWGEASPFPGFGVDVGSCMRAAVSAAFEPWPVPVRNSVPVHVTVPALGPQEAAALVRASGCRAAKVKVAQGDDEARVEAVREVLGPAGRLVIDANGAWDVDVAIARIRRLYRYSIDLVEQPVRSLVDMARVRRAVEVPLAADELAFSAEAVQRIVHAEAADVLVIKVQALGGLAAALQAIEAAGLPVIVSSLLETSIGLSAGVALAAALPELPYPCGLGTAALLDGDLVADPLVPVDGRVPVRRPPAVLERLHEFAIAADPVEGPVARRIREAGR
ncbi:MAG: enolase C-terminal domain-like protein [Actinomycetota bacterium]